MTVNMEDIRNGIVTNLAAIPDCQRLPYRAANPTLPALIVVGFEEMEATTFQGGGYTIGMLVQGLAGAPTNKSAEQRLDQWLSPMGDVNVWAALESDRTLDGTVSTSFVTLCDGSQLITLDNGTQALGTTWHLQVEL